MVDHHLSHVLQQVAGKDEVSEFLVIGAHDHAALALPLFLAFIDKDDILTDTHDRIHVVGIDDGGHLKFFRDALQQTIDDK